MIQMQTMLNVADNSGARKIRCIHYPHDRGIKRRWGCKIGWVSGIGIQKRCFLRLGQRCRAGERKRCEAAGATLYDGRS